MRLRLRDHLYWCNCAGRAVFLDVAADRYFCLPEKANRAFLRLAGARSQLGDSSDLAAMIQRKMLVEDKIELPFQSTPMCERAASDLLDGEPFRTGWPKLLRALLAERRAESLLRNRPLLKILQDIEQENACKASIVRDAAELRAIASASRAASLVTRSKDRCLVRALAVHSMCRRQGLGATLVFGVRTDPFAAHCWVQSGKTVLVGDFEQVRLYTPILAVE
jgi:transglutaminase superfamily protein